MSLNLDSPIALYSIPVVWLTAFYPVPLKMRAMMGTIGFNNSLPRENFVLAKSSQRLDRETKERIVRLEGAHQNGMENLPIWFAAVTVGHIAGVPNRTLNLFSIAYISTRMLYNYVYINQSTHIECVARSVIYFCGLAMPLSLLVKSANKMQPLCLHKVPVQAWRCLSPVFNSLAQMFKRLSEM